MPFCQQGPPNQGLHDMGVFLQMETRSMASLTRNPSGASSSSSSRSSTCSRNNQHADIVAMDVADEAQLLLIADCKPHQHQSAWRASPKSAMLFMILGPRARYQMVISQGFLSSTLFCCCGGVVSCKAMCCHPVAQCLLHLAWQADAGQASLAVPSLWGCWHPMPRPPKL